MKKKRSWKKALLILLSVVLGLILVLVVAATIVINAMLNKIPRVERVEHTLSAEEIESIVKETDPIPEGTYETMNPEDIQMPETGAGLISKPDHVVNILLIGQDSGAGIRSRSDSMILCTVNLKEKTLVMTSFLRDLYIDLPDFNGVSYEDNRLNTCYMFGGTEMLNQALLNNFGIQVDHNVAVDFSSFPRIIDMMGGVGICLTPGEAAHMRLKEGFNLLNGKQALAYARIRAIDSDFTRTYRQRNVIMTLLEQIRNADAQQLVNLIDTLFPMVTTDMTNGEIIGYALEFLPILSSLEVTSQHIPIEGAYTATYVRGMSVLIPDFGKNREYLEQTLGS